jgi:protocatechuate 3,4-dioxygenase beta subunit
MTTTAVEPRTVELVGAVVDALSEIVRRHGVTDAEWYGALDFIGRVARADELVLLSDVLGLSVLVDRQTNAGHAGTPSNVLGPFWRPAPEIPNPGALADEDDPGEPLVVRGTVTAADGPPLPGVRVDLWQCDGEGRYDVQLGDGTERRYRGVLATDGEGRYEIRTIVPPPYEVPKDGPVGELLARLGRHAFRPAHIHYQVEAEGYAPLTTMVFFAGDPWLGDDTIGADRPELTVPIDRSTSPSTASFDIALDPARPSYQLDS